ncbi:GNAT family N-acetyltransferase [Arenibaculum pallidiluteum]|uniref:GNAT family N-acetyltransferase n=1 Tax=Arenibaculum pallidiluteum TaxID=2812559 RepID=UPI001A95DCD4|nr:GNAT family N-acetyltransferase [Arenibaculum pallidiluteum]
MDEPVTDNPVTDNRGRSRFELEVDGLLAFADYRRGGSVIQILHVEAAVPLRGTGAAGRLMQGIAERAREEGAKIVPYCGYARAWFRRNKGSQDLLA